MGSESATPGLQNDGAGDTGSANGQNTQTPSGSGQTNDQQGGAAKDDATTTQQDSRDTAKESQPGSTDAKKSDATAAASESMDAFAAANKDVLTDGQYTFAYALSGHWLIDIENGSVNKDARVQTYADNFTLAQRWNITHDAKGYLVITGAQSGKALDIASGNKKPGGKVQQWDSNGSLAQRWIAVNDGDGIALHSALDKNLVLDIPGSSNRNKVFLQTRTANGTAARRWASTNETTEMNDFAAANRGALKDGECGLASALNGNKLLDVANGSVAAGANVQLYSNNRSSAQRWKVTHDANGFVTFTSVKSGKALDVYSGTRGNGVNVQQWSSNGSMAQKWIATPTKDANGYVIHSAMNKNGSSGGCVGGDCWLSLLVIGVRGVGGRVRRI